MAWIRLTTLLIGLLLLALPEAAAAAGLTVTVKSGESVDAAIEGEVRLYGNSHALVIGIDAYDAGWPRLSNAVKDAELVAEALSARGFEVTLLRELDADALEEALEDFFIEKGADPEARLFVWFAGHGHSERGQGYLVPVDAPLPQASETAFRRKALSLRRLGEYVREARAKHVFAVFDACFTGTIFDSSRSAPPPAVTRATARPVRQFLSSGDADQKVSDDGSFRDLFLEALAGERRADANQDGYLTASELGLFMTDAVANYTQNRQTPRYGKLRDPAFDRGDFVFLLPDPNPPPGGEGEAPEVPKTPAPSADTERLFWESIRKSEDAADFQAYLDSYPEGAFAPLARNRLAKLQPEPAGEWRGWSSRRTEEIYRALSAATIRDAPFDDADEVGRVSAGQEVAVVAHTLTKEWFKVTDPEGVEGYLPDHALVPLAFPVLAPPAAPVGRDGFWRLAFDLASPCSGTSLDRLRIEGRKAVATLRHDVLGFLPLEGWIRADDGVLQLSNTNRGYQVSLEGSLGEADGAGNLAIKGRVTCGGSWTAQKTP